MSCDFCDMDHARYYQYKDAVYDRLIYEDEHWQIIPTLGAFIGGYVLHVLKRHTLSSYYCNKDELNSLKNNIQRVLLAYQTAYSTKHTYVFEHGVLDDSYKGACCVDHTHIHMFPSQRDIYNLVAEQFVTHYAETSRLEDCYERIKEEKMMAYLIFGDPIKSNFCLVNTSLDIYPSQYFRQIIYKILVGSPLNYGWDWRRFTNIEIMKRTIDDLKNIIPGKVQYETCPIVTTER